MNSAEAAKSMQQLLSLWAETYGSQAAPSGEPEVEQFSSPASSSDDNDQLIRQVSGLLSEKFRQLEIQAFQTLFHAVEELNRRCAKIEEALTQRNPDTVIHKDTQKSNLPQPSESSNTSNTATSRLLPTPASPLGPESNPSMDLDAMKTAMDLFARISQLATTSRQIVRDPWSWKFSKERSIKSLRENPTEIAVGKRSWWWLMRILRSSGS
jgi:hypothetical protein